MFKKVFSLILVLVLSVTAVPLVGLAASAATVRVSKIKLSTASATLALGGTKQLTATITPSNATNKAVTWTSSNTKVATVSVKGLVTAKAVGKATVTCKAKDGSGKNATCAVTVIPKAPTGVKAASVSYNSVKISWTAVSGSTGYAVYRATSQTGTYSLLKTVTANSYTDTKLTAGKTYYYKVRAYKTVSNTKYYSAYSAIVSAKALPAVPTGVKVVSVNSDSIKIAWTAVSSVTGYAIYRATSQNGTYSLLKSVTATDYTDAKLTANKAYYYKVRAYKTISGTNYYSAYSAVVNFTAMPAAKAASIFDAAINNTKAYTGSVKVKRVEGITTTLTEFSLGILRDTVEGMLPNDYPKTKEATFKNGKDVADANSTLTGFIPPPDGKDATLTAAGIKSFTFMPVGKGYKITITLIEEKGADIDYIPPHHASCMDTLALTSDDLGDFTLNEATVIYKGATIIAEVNANGVLTSLKISEPVSLSGKIGYKAFKGITAAIDGLWKQDITFTY